MLRVGIAPCSPFSVSNECMVEGECPGSSGAGVRCAAQVQSEIKIELKARHAKAWAWQNMRRRKVEAWALLVACLDESGGGP